MMSTCWPFDHLILVVAQNDISQVNSLVCCTKEMSPDSGVLSDTNYV